MHPLKKWLIENKHTGTWLGQKIGVHPVAVSNYLNTNRFPQPHILVKILEVTKNQVSFNEWIAFMKKENDEKNAKEAEEKTT